MEHLIEFFMKHIHSKSHMIFQFTPGDLTLVVALKGQIKVIVCSLGCV